MGLYDEMMPKRPAGAPQAPQTFAQLQQQGMARPPGPWAPMMGAGRRHTDYMGPGMPSVSYAGGAAPPPPNYMAAQRGGPPGHGHEGLPPPPGLGGYGSQPTMVPPEAPAGGALGYHPPGPSDPFGAPGNIIPNPNAPLDQSTLEEYLFQMLKDPTSTNTYKHIMQGIGADVDTDASRRGVYYSTIPGGEKAQAGSNLAVGLQQQAFGNLMGYENSYMDWLLKTMGMS